MQLRWVPCFAEVFKLIVIAQKVSRIFLNPEAFAHSLALHEGRSIFSVEGNLGLLCISHEELAIAAEHHVQKSACNTSSILD